MPEFTQNVPAWRRATAAMSLRERGAYASLMAWIVEYRQPLPYALDVLCNLIGVGNRRSDREAVVSVLDRFGVKAGGGWMLAEAEAEISKNVSADKQLAVTRDRSRIRRARCRDIAKTLREGLRELGVNVPWNASMKELRELGSKHGISWAGAGLEARIDPAPVTRDETVTVTPVTRDRTPIDLLAVSSLRSETPKSSSFAPAPLATFGEVSKAMRAQGLADAHPGHETLRELVNEGVPVEDFALVAAEAVVKGKRFAWALATLKGRRADALRGTAKRGGRDHQAELAEWAPMLVDPRLADASRIDGMAPQSASNQVGAAPLAKNDLIVSKRV